MKVFVEICSEDEMSLYKGALFLPCEPVVGDRIYFDGTPAWEFCQAGKVIRRAMSASPKDDKSAMLYIDVLFEY